MILASTNVMYFHSDRSGTPRARRLFTTGDSTTVWASVLDLARPAHPPSGSKGGAAGSGSRLFNVFIVIQIIADQVGGVAKRRPAAGQPGNFVFFPCKPEWRSGSARPRWRNK